MDLDRPTPTQTESTTTPIFHPTTKHITTRARAWQQAITNSDLNNSPNVETMFNTAAIKIGVAMAIADAGVTSHFLLPDSPVSDVTPTTRPL